MSADNGLVEVQILGMPVDVYRAASEHTDELMREFALIKEAEADGVDAERRQVPQRLLELVGRLTSEFGGFTGAQTAQLQEAMAAGAVAIDLRYRVPGAVRQACLDLGQMLDEADEFCRQGEELLTLATPAQSVAFRVWFLGEFVRQIDGQAPTPWGNATA